MCRFHVVLLEIMLNSLFLCALVIPGFAVGLNKAAHSDVTSRKLEMIMKQAELCSYISLCTKSNSSVYRKPKYGTRVPCCQECSCDNTCKTHGTCCPDAEITESHTHLLTVQKPSSNRTRERKVCIKIKFGNLINTYGYMMIGSCPDTFKDDVIRFNCESNFEFSSTVSLLNHIPVSDTVTGLTYKNHYCELCNRGPKSVSVVWDVWLECGATRFLFPYYLVRDPSELAAETISVKKRACNIAFHLNMAKNNFTELQSCEVDNIIDTCNKEYHGSETEKFCMGYSWPIKVMTGVRTYKNYHCMVCNGQKFQERCFSPIKVNFAVSLNMNSAKIEQIDSTDSDANTISEQVFKDQIIGRFFPNEAGNVHCPKGFIYDSKKDRCRHVLCPLYFFVKKGICVSMFGLVKGIFYTVRLKLLVPDSIKHAEQHDFEKSVSSSIYSFLSDRLGETNFKFHLWSSQTLPGKLDTTKPYLIELIVEENVYGRNYTSVLEFVNNFVLRVKKINLSLHMEGEIKNETIGICFSSSIIWTNLKPYGFPETYRLISSTTEITENLGIENATEVVISESSLCYRTNLNDDEFQQQGVNQIRIFETDAILLSPDYFKITVNEEERTISCINKAFKEIPDSSNNVFFNEKRASYRQVSRSNVKIQHADEVANANDGDDVDPLLWRSVLATICTVGLLVFLTGIRLCIGKLHKRHEQLNGIDLNPGFDDGTVHETHNVDGLVTIQQSINSYESLTRHISAKQICSANRNQIAICQSESSGVCSVKIQFAHNEQDESASGLHAALIEESTASLQFAVSNESSTRIQTARNEESASEMKPTCNYETESEILSVSNDKSATEIWSACNDTSAAEYRSASNDTSAAEYRSASNDTSAAEIRSASIDASVAEIRSASNDTSAAENFFASNDTSAAEIRSASNDTSAEEIRSASNDASAEEIRSASIDISAAEIRSASSTEFKTGLNPLMNDKSTASFQSASNNESADGAQSASNEKSTTGIQSVYNDDSVVGIWYTRNVKSAGGIHSVNTD